MKRIIILTILLIPFFCRGEDNRIKDFESDGCTLFPDSSAILKKDWCECCFKHDIAYWQGGTRDERLKADMALKDCVLKKTGNKNLAELIYRGVRVGGSPYFYNWYRWGYGWDYKRKYKKLSDEEKKQVEIKLKKYYSDKKPHPCNQD